MAAPTSTHEVTARRLSSVITQLWDKINGRFLGKNDKAKSAETADNASWNQFTVPGKNTSGADNYMKVTNSQQSIYLDVMYDGKRGVYYGNSNSKAGGWALAVDANNNIQIHGGEFTTPIRFNASSMIEASGTLTYLCGIDNFSDGGELHYKPIHQVMVGRSLYLETWKTDGTGTYGDTLTVYARWITNALFTFETSDSRCKFAPKYVKDYGDEKNDNVIQIGWKGDSLSSATHLAAYATINNAICIKDIPVGNVKVGNATNADSADSATNSDKVDGFHVSVTINGTAQSGGTLQFIG